MRNLISILIFCSFSIFASEVEKTGIQPRWHIHTPEGGVEKKSGPVQVVNIRLLTHENVIDKNLTVEELVEFVKGLEQAVMSSYLPDEKGELLLTVDLVKDSEFGFRFQYRGDLTQAFLERVSENIGKQKNLMPRNDNVSFQVHYSIGATVV